MTLPLTWRNIVSAGQGPCDELWRGTGLVAGGKHSTRSNVFAIQRRAYARLGISGRAQLAAVLREHGPLS